MVFKYILNTMFNFHGKYSNAELNDYFDHHTLSLINNFNLVLSLNKAGYFLIFILATFLSI